MRHEVCTALRPSCRSLDGCTSRGRTTARSAWIRTPGHRLADSVSPFHKVRAPRASRGAAGQRRRVKRRRGKDIRLRRGAEANPGTGVTDRAGPCRTRLAGWSSHQHSGRKRTISRYRPPECARDTCRKTVCRTVATHFSKSDSRYFSDPYAHNTWLVVTTVVTDPRYLIEPLIMHAHFKKIPDASGGILTPCRADEPR